MISWTLSKLKTYFPKVLLKDKSYRLKETVLHISDKGRAKHAKDFHVST